MTHPQLHATLPSGQARTLALNGEAVLCVIAGRVWATRSGSTRHPPCDHFLVAGQSLALCGARWVVESMDGLPARYELVPAPRPATSLAPDRDALGQVHPQREDRRGREQAASHPGAPVTA